MKNARTTVISEIISKRIKTSKKRILVVGCGSGVEAAVLAIDLAAEVTGIDLIDEFNNEASQYANLKIGDATSLKFADGCFDIVFSYHALEHISNYHKALDEMHRVLAAEGLLCVGTPNRNRFLGYIGGGSRIVEKRFSGI